MTRTVHTVANIGFGTMGHATALQFAAAGYRVRLFDQNEALLASGMDA